MSTPRAVLAFDKFRGTATADQLVSCAASAASEVGWQWSKRAMADGGEGSLDVLGGANRKLVVANPLGEATVAHWRLDHGTAYIEAAQASGLGLVGGKDLNDALAADTFGTGQLIGNAVDLGVDTIVVLLGGSATTDGGHGALRALPSKAALKGVDLLVAADVETLFVDAAAVFGPQKGATPAQVKLLTRRLERLQQEYESTYGVDVATLVGAGAAGGLAGGLVAVGGRLVSGFDVLAESVDFGSTCAGADLVITGEGYLDEESFGGKVVGGVARWAAAEGVPTLAIVGDRDHSITVPDGVTVVCLTEQFGRDRSMNETSDLVAQVVSEALSAF